jgi:hypothetical protein
VRALAILGVEAGALWVFIASVSAVVKAIDVMILAIVGKVSIRPVLNPMTSALAWQLIVTCWCRNKHTCCHLL